MGNNATEQLHRRNIVLTERTVERLNTLRKNTEASTDSEVVRRGIVLYARIVDYILAGNRIQIVAQNGETRELELLCCDFNSGADAQQPLSEPAR